MSEKRDHELVEASQKGDKASFGLLIERYRPMIEAAIRRMVTDELFHHDLFQEAVLSAYLSLDTLHNGRKFRSWLYGITRHVCLMFLRLQRVQYISLDLLEETGGRLPSQQPSPDEIAERLELRRVMMNAISQLSKTNQETILLFYYEDFNLQETATLLGTSVNTVKGRLHRARKHLQQLLSSLYQSQEGEKQMISVEVVDVVMRDYALSADKSRKQYQLVLMDDRKHRAIIIWIGEYEGLSIAFKLNNANPIGRPMTQTFIARLIEASGAKLERVEINELKDEVFYATVHLDIDGKVRQVDARPSDAIGLAVHTDTPLFVSEQVMEQVGFTIPEKHKPNKQGIAEIQSWLEELRKSDSAYMEQIKESDEYQQLFDHRKQGAVVIEKVFDPIDS